MNLNLFRSFARNFKAVFSIDVRSLALFRMVLAGILLCDVFTRLSNLFAHYSDGGILPRHALLKFDNSFWEWSIHMLSGASEVQLVLFFIQIVAAVFLLIGFRSRLMLFISWFLLISLHSRNFLLLQAGDVYLRVLMFWGLFLPLGATWSIDRALATNEPKRDQSVFSAATVAILLQVFIVYFFTALLKLHPIWTQEGSAVYYALSIDQLVLPLGHWIYQFGDVLKFITFATLYFEFIGPFLPFIPYKNDRFRMLAIFLFLTLHIGFVFTLDIGLFPYICMMAWLLYLPSSFWNKILQRQLAGPRSTVEVYYDGDCGFCKKMALILKEFCLPQSNRLEPAQLQPRLFERLKQENSWIVLDHKKEMRFRFDAVLYVLSQNVFLKPFAIVLRIPPLFVLGDHLYRWVAKNRVRSAKLVFYFQYRKLNLRLRPILQVFVIVCFAYVVMWNVRTLNFDKYNKYFPEKYNWFGQILRIDQYWSMFAPFPYMDDGFYVLPATTMGGIKFDYLRNKPVSFEKPACLSCENTSQRWVKLYENLWKKKHSHYREYLARYICRTYNEEKTGNDRINELKIYYVKEQTYLNYRYGKLKPILLWEHWCIEPPEDRQDVKDSEF